LRVHLRKGQVPRRPLDVAQSDLRYTNKSLRPMGVAPADRSHSSFVSHRGNGQPDGRSHFGSKLTSIGSWVSCVAGSHRHFCMAFSAACTRTGWPPFTATDFTAPFGATTASIRTVPFKFMVRASWG